MTVEIRPLRAADAAAARALAAAEVAGTPYGELPLGALARALGSPDAEARALVAVSRGDLVGVIVFGTVAGAVGTGKLHLVAVTAAARLMGVATQLVDAAVAELASEGARMVVAEVPDDPRLRPGLVLLERCGFGEEARVPDYFRDGIALTLLRRGLE